MLKSGEKKCVVIMNQTEDSYNNVIYVSDKYVNDGSASES